MNLRKSGELNDAPNNTPVNDGSMESNSESSESKNESEDNFSFEELFNKIFGTAINIRIIESNPVNNEKEEGFIPSLDILVFFAKDVHDDIHILEIQQELLAKQQEQLAGKLNELKSKETRISQDMARTYNKMMLFSCKTGQPTQLADINKTSQEEAANDQTSGFNRSPGKS